MTMKMTAETIELADYLLPDLLAFGDYLLKWGYQLMPNYAEETLALLAGSYFSNYGKPIREYKAKEGKLNKRTIMLWMGDARNNHLPSEEKIFKDLCGRVKKYYWLNS
ncbi:hypothetical protein [Lactobacillus delbrueckii]|uniref:hypothetical protein n=1 Tax=Lactobacillus delbrueckii TaxID=1584 RepID=UPI0025B10E2A|nr:hypothetical protein [Lactobacillus delbrueckii]MDF4029005.1 hypothetical protein [Lactobacillus delbrueckii]